MSALKKPVAALIGVLGLLLAGLFFSVSSAGAYPSSTPAQISVSDSTPAAGSSVTVSGTAYQPNETVSLEFHSAVTSLGSAQADGSGAFSVSVTIPSSASGSHEIVGTGLTSGEVASVALEVGGSSNGGSSSGSGGSLSSTGVAVVGIGAVGVVLLVGGGLLLMAGKRRKVSV